MPLNPIKPPFSYGFPMAGNFLYALAYLARQPSEAPPKRILTACYLRRLRDRPDWLQGFVQQKQRDPAAMVKDGSMEDLQDPLIWRYCTICLAIFWGYIPWKRGLIYGRYLHFRILKFPLNGVGPAFVPGFFPWNNASVNVLIKAGWFWLVVWNMLFFPYIGNNHPNPTD